MCLSVLGYRGLFRTFIDLTSLSIQSAICPEHGPPFTVGKSAVARPSLVPSIADDSPDESTAMTTEGGQPLIPSAITRQNELTHAELKEIEKRLRVTTLLLCVYASIWGMGGHLVGEASRVMCSAYVRQVCLPLYGERVLLYIITRFCVFGTMPVAGADTALVTSGRRAADKRSRPSPVCPDPPSAATCLAVTSRSGHPQSAPFELRQYIRESNLFNFVVDIRGAKLMPIGDDAGACPGALPRGMWTLDPHWAMQVNPRKKQPLS